MSVSERSSRTKELTLPSFKALDLALARLPGNDIRLTADSGKWSEVISGLKASRNKNTQALLRQFHFTERKPLPPHSDTLEDFLFFAGLTDKFTITSPDYDTFKFSQDIKESILERSDPRLTENFESSLQEMTEGLSVLVIPQT